MCLNNLLLVLISFNQPRSQSISARSLVVRMGVGKRTFSVRFFHAFDACCLFDNSGLFAIRIYCEPTKDYAHNNRSLLNFVKFTAGL